MRRSAVVALRAGGVWGDSAETEGHKAGLVMRSFGELNIHEVKWLNKYIYIYKVTEKYIKILIILYFNVSVVKQDFYSC